jgi:decaprenyl-phosphate phosphoribosyltransferase
MMRDIITLMRPQQWAKNLFVFIPAFFDGMITRADSLFPAVITFASFCLAASSVYCFNDIRDAESDRRHAEKRHRPIASGAVTKMEAYTLMTVLAVSASALCAFLLHGSAGTEAGSTIAAYYLINIAYCVWLKNVALIDVFIIALGFVLRIIAGGFSSGIILSDWIILMTFLLALFLAFAKRRDDVMMYEDRGVKARRNINRYNLEFMNSALSIVASVTMVCYIMYTVSSGVEKRLGSNYLYLTSMFVLLGILRYLQITVVENRSGSPTKVLLKDRFVEVCICLWIISFIIIIYL